MPFVQIAQKQSANFKRKYAEKVNNRALNAVK